MYKCGTLGNTVVSTIPNLLKAFFLLPLGIINMVITLGGGGGEGERGGPRNHYLWGVLGTIILGGGS